MDISQSLISTVREGRLTEVKNLIRSYGLTYSDAWSEGYILLCSAINNGHSDITKLLLKKGSRVNIENQIPTYTPLHGAVKKFKLEIIKMLIDRGANINVSDQVGATPLHYAIESKNIFIVKHLLNSGANVDAREQYGKTPLYLAVQKQYRGIVKLLLEHRANVDIEYENSKTILYLAVEGKCLPIIQLILKNSPDVNKKSNKNSLYTAIRGNGKKFTEIIDILLEYGFSVNAEDANNFGLLDAAVWNGHLKIVEVLLNQGADVNMLNSLTSQTLLHTAAKCKQKEIAELLIKNGTNVNAKDRYQKTPLFYSIHRSDLEITKLLLTNGADVDAKDETEKAPIFYCIKSRDLEITKLLITSGADITPELLINAAQKAQKEYNAIIEVLLQNGVNINITDVNGKTALHLASEQNSEVTVETLLKNGADINIFDKTGMQPIELAFGSFNQENFDILTEHIIEMKIAKLFLNGKNLLINSNGRRYLEDECKEELQTMKNENITDKISYHDVLIKNIDQLAKYAKNKNVVDVLTSDDYETKFPIYYHMIKNNLRKGVERKKLLEEVNKFIIFPELPQLCTENIMSYLSNDDLKKFISIITEN